jgi:hypothetical protein
VKWRCTWCGKPHAEDDPPCDECGHNAFEEAVVRQDETEPRTETVDTGTTYVWRCRDCGRDHVRNNPPCSRCHGHDLEKVEQTYDDVERDLDVPGWLEVAKPYVPVFAIIGVVVLLFATGIISPSVLPGIGSPSPPDAPGEEAEAAGIDLEETELLVHERLADERNGETEYGEDLEAFAEYHNRANVAAEYEGADPDRPGAGEFGVECNDDLLDVPFILSESDIHDYDDEAALADDIVDAVFSIAGGEADDDYSSNGLDVHVTPDDSVSVYYAAC